MVKIDARAGILLAELTLHVAAVPLVREGNARSQTRSI